MYKDKLTRKLSNMIVCRSYIIAASFQLFNAMALALDQCANFNSALCLWSFHGDVRDFGKSLRSVFEGGPSSVAFCQPLPRASAPFARSPRG